MINGRNIEEEKKRIDKFFSELSNEEFEKMLLECGAIPKNCNNCGYMGNDCDGKELCEKYKF